MRTLAVGLVALLLTLVGCSSSDGVAGSAPATLGLVADDDRFPFDAAGDGDLLRLAMVEPASYRADEVVLSDQAGVIVADLLYDGLTEVDGADGVLRAGLAASWHADDDFRSWTFELDPAAGVDGSDVVASLGSLVPDLDGGWHQRRPMVALTAGIVAVTAPDPTTVVVELAEPNAGLPWVLSGLPYSIVGIDGAPTGDWQIAVSDSTGVTLRPRPAWFSSEATYGEIRVEWVPDAAGAARLLADGAVAAALVSPASLDDVETRVGRGAARSTTSAVSYYVLNSASDRLATRDQRAAVLATIDPAALIGESGRFDLVALDGLVPAGMAGFEPDACADGCRPSEQDTEADRSVSGGSDADPLRVSFAGAEQAGAAEALVGELTAAGFLATATEVSARDLASAIVDGSTDLFAFGWVAPAGSVDALLPPLLGADSPANVSRVVSPELTELLEQAAVTAGDEARWALLDEAHRAALADARVLPLAVTGSTLVLSSYAPGLVVRADGSLDLESPP